MTINGNLASDPEIRFTAGGKAVCEIVVATSKSKRLDDGTWENGPATYWTVKAWGRLGENAAESLRKGDPVIVCGNAENRTWENKDGTKGHKIEVTAWAVGYDLKRNPATINRDGAPNTTQSSPHVDPWAATNDNINAPF